MKKWIFLISLMLTFAAHADDCDNQNICQWNCAKTSNDSCTATLDKTSKTLTVSGTGQMADYNDILNDTGNFIGVDTPWYNYKNSIQSLIVDEGITTLGARAFKDIRQISNVNLPDGLQKIGPGAFNTIFALNTIDIPDSVTEIGVGAFADCRNLKNIQLSENLTTIDYMAFANTGIIDLVLPESVTSISPGLVRGGIDYWEQAKILNLYCGETISAQCEKALKWKKDLGINVQVISYQKTPNGQIFYNNKWYNNANDILSGNYAKKRIYTVEEAAKVSKDTRNTLKIRYK